MKKSALFLAAAATLVASLSLAAPASAASLNWGFDTPWLGVQSNRSVSSNHLSASDRVHVGPFRSNIGLSLGRSHVDRCAARFRSYDVQSDTYMGFDGERHRCRL